MKLLMAMLFASLILSVSPAIAAPADEVKAAFHRFVDAQNAHDVAAVRELLSDSPDFLWITRGAPIWGRDAALTRFETLYEGTWKLSPDHSNLRVVMLSDMTAQLFVPIMFNMGPPGQPAPDTPFLMNQTWVKSAAGWRIAAILPIPLPTPAPVPSK